MPNIRTVLTLGTAIIALGAVAAWPAYLKHEESGPRPLPTTAPVTADYLLRDKTIAFWERALHERHRGDMISPRQASGEYLQRYRERGDVGDVLRAVATAKQSLVAQPRYNTGAMVELASAQLTLHKFRDALATTKAVERFMPGDPDMEVREASLDLELGDYANASRILAALPPAANPYAAIGRDTLQARYDELTGHLTDARELLKRPAAYTNAQFEAPAQSRAWFSFRAGEMAFEAGANGEAIADETQALAIFPNYADALRLRARFECATHAWDACRTDAIASANVVPFPETLGYEADAQRALGQAKDAAATDALIRTVERIGNTQHISDRLLAIYYSEHRMYPDDAYRIARGELAARDDIFTQDTLAWAAAMDGRWDVARTEIAKATHLGTENALLDYHAGAIALHFGDRAAAKTWFEKALALNPSFHPFYADDARKQLAAL